MTLEDDASFADVHTPRALQLSTAASERFVTRAVSSGLTFDDGQQSAIERLATPLQHGAYLHGEVGRGKTTIANLYADALEYSRLRRFHFHDFFRDLQTRLASQHHLDDALTDMLGDAEAVLFDEFHVHDVADAVYLTHLVDYLFEREILLIATSNYPPAGLLPHPEFHERFAPAIARIEDHLSVIDLGEGVDFRSHLAPQSTGFASGSWLTGAAAKAALPADAIELNGFSVPALDPSPTFPMFRFADLCDRPIGVREYLTLGEEAQSVTVVDVPDLARAESQPLQRLSTLVDVLYTLDVPLHVVADGDAAAMTRAAIRPKDLPRTLSRLGVLRRGTVDA